MKEISLNNKSEGKDEKILHYEKENPNKEEKGEIPSGKQGNNPGVTADGETLRIRMTIGLINDRNGLEDLIPLNNKYQRGAGYKLPAKIN